MSKASDARSFVDILLMAYKVDESNDSRMRLRFHIFGGPVINVNSIDYDGEKFVADGNQSVSENDKSLLRSIMSIKGVLLVKLEPESVVVVVDRERISWGTGYYILRNALKDHIDDGN